MTGTTGEQTEPQTRQAAAWPLFLLAAPAFVAIWSGWVGIGRLTGFGPVELLPGIWDGATVDTAITLPIGMETYAAYALAVWFRQGCAASARKFAKWSAIGSLMLGAGGQVAYHLMVAAGYTRAPWQITAAVACLPVAVLGMGVTLGHLVRQGAGQEMVAERERTDPEAARLVGAARTARAALDALKPRPDGGDAPTQPMPGSEVGADAPTQTQRVARPQRARRPAPAAAAERDPDSDARTILAGHLEGAPMPGIRTLRAEHGWPEAHCRRVAARIRDLTTDAGQVRPLRAVAGEDGA